MHIVHRHIDEFQTRMLEFEDRQEPLNVTWAFPALTGDIIMDYFFGFNYGSTKDPGFSSFHAAFKIVGLTGHIAMQFPWFLPVSERLVRMSLTSLRQIYKEDHARVTIAKMW